MGHVGLPGCEFKSKRGCFVGVTGGVIRVVMAEDVLAVFWGRGRIHLFERDVVKRHVLEGGRHGKKLSRESMSFLHQLCILIPLGTCSPSVSRCLLQSIEAGISISQWHTHESKRAGKIFVVGFGYDHRHKKWIQVQIC